MLEYYQKSKEAIFKELKTTEQGLSNAEAKIHLKKYGKNKITSKKKFNPLVLLFKQFHSSLVYILLVAAAISYFVESFIDVYVILAIIAINAGIGFSQDYKAEKSIRALKKLIVSYSKVYRNNELIKIRSTNLVPGDVISLESGDKIPADCRLLNIKNFQTNEASLTGESSLVTKNIEIINKKLQIADQMNMVFMGTFASTGTALAVVIGTGNNSVIGDLAKDLQQIPTEKSHFQKKTDILAKQMAMIAIISSLIVFSIGYFIRGFEFSEIFLVTIATLVSAIPEGLPAVLAIVLAIGSFRMSKRNALIRNLPATETLGVVTTILTDKTGTLTENSMNVESILLPGYEEINVSGRGWDSKGFFSQSSKIIDPLNNQHLMKLINVASLCNTSKVIYDKYNKKYTIIGDPTEAALSVLGNKAKLKNLKEQKIEDLPFNTSLKYRASLSKVYGKKNICSIGAPEVVLSMCTHFLKKNSKKPLTSTDKKQITSQIDELSKKGSRVLAISYKLSEKSSKLSEKEITKMVFIGLVGIRDPPRSDVRTAIRKTHSAGIRVIMVTGDHKETALAIAKDIELVDENAKALTGEELEKLSEKDFNKALKEISVFARLTPKMKLKIATALQASGEIIAMTGDGVNDASALKKADIGISMGIMGTDVAREASDIILADDNFSSIVNAIEEGRIVFTNTRQASSFLITTNIAEVVTIVGTMIINLPIPLLPTQILWLNLVTDGVNDVAIASEPGHSDVLNHPPRNKEENFITKEILPFVILMSAIMFITTLFVFLQFLPTSLEKARTGAFVVMAFTQIFNVFNMRSLKESVFKIGLFSNKYATASIIVSTLLLFAVIYLPLLQGLFMFVRLELWEVILLIALSSSVLIMGETYKYIQNRPKKTSTPLK